jgi:hypothetical protein
LREFALAGGVIRTPAFTLREVALASGVSRTLAGFDWKTGVWINIANAWLPVCVGYNVYKKVNLYHVGIGMGRIGNPVTGSLRKIFKE